jgi:hypothetical protein
MAISYKELHQDRKQVIKIDMKKIGMYMTRNVLEKMLKK